MRDLIVLISLFLLGALAGGLSLLRSMPTNRKWLLRTTASLLILIAISWYIRNPVQNWVTQNTSLVSAVGNFGQFAAAIFAAVAAGLSWRSAQVANEEAARSRRSFQFSWEPLLEVKFETSAHLNTREFELVLPRRASLEQKYSNLPQSAQTLVTQFLRWRDDFGNREEYRSLGNPHPSANYLAVTIRNLQENPVGQAVGIGLLLEFVFAQIDQSPQDLQSDPELLVVPVVFKLDRISPSGKVVAWLADISNVPHLKVSVRAIECKTWDETTVITRGICEELDLSGQQPKDTVRLMHGRRVFSSDSDEAGAVELLPAYESRHSEWQESRVNILGFENQTPLKIVVEHGEREVAHNE